ncbi:MAG: hypothetical protein RL385_4751, partial [Pseudomonadota bacterium]
MPPEASRRATSLLLLALIAGCGGPNEDQAVATSTDSATPADDASHGTSIGATATGAAPVGGATAVGEGASSARPAGLPSLPSSAPTGSAMGSAETSASGDAPIPSGATVPSFVAVPSSSPDPMPQGGTLTAGSWDDNLNYAHFTAYRGPFDAQTAPGILPFE